MRNSTPGCVVYIFDDDDGIGGEWRDQSQLIVEDDIFFLFYFFLFFINYFSTSPREREREKAPEEIGSPFRKSFTLLSYTEKRTLVGDLQQPAAV